MSPVMTRASLSLCLAAVIFLPAVAFTQSAAHRKTPTKTELALPQLTEKERAQQILDRFTFGPRPGDVAAVMKVGRETWFEKQLNPDSIPDAELDKRLTAYPY